MFDPRITFGVKKIPLYTSEGGRCLSSAIDALDKLASREVTGNDGIAYLRKILESLSVNDAKVIELIIGKKSKAGFGTSIINKEMGSFKVYKPKYMGAQSYSKKKVDTIFSKHSFAYSEVKMDGKYLNVIMTGTDFFMESRQGIRNYLMGALQSDIEQMMSNYGGDVVVNGELLLSPVLKGDMSRYTSNGIISAFISISKKLYDGKDITNESTKFKNATGFSLIEVRDMLSLIIWDYIPYENYLDGFWDCCRSDRIDNIPNIIDGCYAIKMVKYKKVFSHSEALTHFTEMLSAGEEGTILKGSEGIWKDGKPSFQSKMKLDITVDMIVTGGNFGTNGTKNENVISSLNVVSSCGRVISAPGGINERDMAHITDNIDSLIGTVVEVKCCGLSHDSSGNYSLLHPSYVRFRGKTTADSLEDIINIEKMAKKLSEEI
jgi:hypothetical protein